METGKGSSPRGENPRKQGSRASREAKHGEGESLTDGPVVAVKRGNARGAKGPCRRQSEQEARQERDDKAHHQSAGASSKDRPSGEIRPCASKRKGFGWKRWSSEIVYGKWGLFNDYHLQYANAKARTDRPES